MVTRLHLKRAGQGGGHARPCMWCCKAHASWAPWWLSRVRSCKSPPGHGRRARRRRHSAAQLNGQRCRSRTRLRRRGGAARDAGRAKAQLDRELLIGLRGEVRSHSRPRLADGVVINYGPHAFSPRPATWRASRSTRRASATTWNSTSRRRGHAYSPTSSSTSQARVPGGLHR